MSNGGKGRLSSTATRLGTWRRHNPRQLDLDECILTLPTGPLCNNPGALTSHRTGDMADNRLSYDSLSSLFPLTSPVPMPLTHPDLLTTRDIHREEDLIRNADSFRQWWSTIIAVKDAAVAEQKLASTSTSPAFPIELQVLGPQLATAEGRLTLQRLTYLYESALARFPTRFKLWKAYLQMRSLYVLGKGTKKKRAGSRKKWAEMKEAMEDEELELETYENGLDAVVGWLEWKALVATFERALTWLPTVRVTGQRILWGIVGFLTLL